MSQDKMPLKDYMVKNAKRDLTTAGKVVKGVAKGVVAGATMGGAGKAVKKAAETFKMGGKTMVMDRGRWKEIANKGSASAKKGLEIARKVGKVAAMGGVMGGVAKKGVIKGAMVGAAGKLIGEAMKRANKPKKYTNKLL